MTTTIYILKLQYNKWYVGKTKNLKQRLNDHFKGIDSSSFTQKYKPIDVEEVIEGCDDFDEEKYTLKYMEKYGINNVRGGPYSSITLSHETIAHIEKSLKGCSDSCFKCGEKGHFAKDCGVISKKTVKLAVKKDIGRGPLRASSKSCDFTVNKPFHLISCFKCGKIGDHEARDCPVNKRIVCFNCGKPGHLSTQCFEEILSSSSDSNNNHSDTITCFKCGKIGHVSTECYSRRESEGRSPSNKKFCSIRCFNCGKPGHLSTECYSK